MAGSSESAATSVSHPIFDFDIGCPQCGYNLRGLTQRRCPECGREFDPEELLRSQAFAPKPSPPVLWTVVSVLLRPISFWKTSQVVNSDGPSGRYLLLVLLTAVLECGAGVRARQAMLHGPIASLGGVGTVIFTGMAGLILFLAIGAHMVLCLPAMPRKTSPRASTGASAVVGYSAVWVVVVIAGLMAAVTPNAVTSNAFIPNMDPTWMGYAFAFVPCLLWAVTLYAGGMARADGKRVAAIWCAISNPFWYLYACILWAVR